MEPNDRIDELASQGLLDEAASLCAERGEHDRACELYEQACSFAEAADQALLGRSFAKAMRLAVLSTNPAVRERAQQGLCQAEPPEKVRLVADDLAARGHGREAGALLGAIQAHAEAAMCFEKAGASVEAATSYERAQKPADAARLLEGLLRLRDSDELGALGPLGPDVRDEARVLLGELYARHGRYEPAVRVLQQLAPSAKTWPRALPTLASSLEKLGLGQALRDLEPELRKHAAPPPRAAGSLPAPPDERVAAEAGPTRLFGRYRVEREVAVTPHARVLEAFDELRGERVAIKLFASRLRGAGRDALQRFVREAQALAQLRHPNVLPLREFLPEGPALVLPWMSGGSLRDLLEREPLSPARAAEIARALLGAVGQAHRLGILHRDIKPANLMFDGAGTAMLADFGAAHLGDSAATVTAGEIGTVSYMAPEQVRGQPATVQSDLYSGGVLLFEMLTSTRPDGSTKPSQCHPDLDPRHDELLARFLAEAPGARFADAQQARQALDALPWSGRVMRRGPPQPQAPRAPAERAQSARLGPAVRPATRIDVGQRRHDQWLERDVLVIELGPLVQERAAAFARSAHPALPLVLRADAERNEAWIAPARGVCLRETGGCLAPRERARLAQALARLHAAGGVHGCVDLDHVYRLAGEVRLAWPARLRADAMADEDLAGLQDLERRPVLPPT